MNLAIGPLLALGMAAWAVVATLVSLWICAVIRRRDRQVPRNDTTPRDRWDR